jgi:hypothetical protein
VLVFDQYGTIVDMQMGLTDAVTPICANLTCSSIEMSVVAGARAGGVAACLPWRGWFQDRELGESRRVGSAPSIAVSASRHFLRGRLAGRVTEMLRQKRLG